MSLASDGSCKIGAAILQLEAYSVAQRAFAQGKNGSAQSKSLR